MPANTTELEKRLWGAADELRANFKLRSPEYLAIRFSEEPITHYGA